MLGFWQAHAPGPHVGLQGLAVTDFAQSLDRPTVLVLDNASIHRAHVVRACQSEWTAKGLTLLFLPPYRPELNHSELRWHRCKHYWVRPQDYQSDHALRQRLEHLLNQVGENYTVTFA